MKMIVVANLTVFFNLTVIPKIGFKNDFLTVTACLNWTTFSEMIKTFYRRNQRLYFMSKFMFNAVFKKKDFI